MDSVTLRLLGELRDINIRNARTLYNFHELENDITELSGFNLEQLKVLFAAGYTLTPPDWISQHG